MTSLFDVSNRQIRSQILKSEGVMSWNLKASYRSSTIRTPIGRGPKTRLPAPDKDGLFDFPGVKAIGRRRDCKAVEVSDLQIDIIKPSAVSVREPRVTLTAIAPGLWDPVSIIAACSKARGLEVFEVDRATAKPWNFNGLDEIKIARICGADSLRPYLSKTSRYLQNETDRVHVTRPPNNEQVALVRQGYMVIDDEQGMKHAGAGEHTWAFKQVLASAEAGVRELLRCGYAWRKAVRTLQDCGLLDVKPGTRGGLVRSVCKWTPLAYLPVTTKVAGALHDDDEHALSCLAEGFRWADGA
jgi:hypothetical protein